MSIDRAKALKAAQKYLAKGQLDRAIVEYEKLVAADPNDARSLLKLGDLYTRKGDTRGATNTYRKVAQQYAQQGFFLKAVAVLKQILKLDPHDLLAVESLAEMYEKLSLTSDAVATYEQVADAYARAGKPEKALNALGKLATLDPENVAAWVRYAEALSKANRIDEAAEAFAKGADLLKAQGRTDDYIKVTERLLFHSTEDLDRVRELAGIYLDRGMGKAALPHLQVCFKADPRDVATLELLARAFGQLGQAVKAASVYKEIARIHADAGRKADEERALRALLELDAGDADAQQRLQVLSMPPADDEDAEAIELEPDEELDEVLVVEEDPSVAAKRSQPPLEDWEREAQVARLLAECDVFLRYGLKDKVVAQLERVLELEPKHVEAREKLRDALLKRGDTKGAITQLCMLAELVGPDDPARARGYLQEALKLSPGDAAVQRALERIDELAASAPAAEDGDDEAILVDDDEVLIVDDADAAAAAPADSRPPGLRIGPRETSLATALEGAEDFSSLNFEDDDEPELEHQPAEDDDEDAMVLVADDEPELEARGPEPEAPEPELELEEPEPEAPEPELELEEPEPEAPEPELELEEPEPEAAQPEPAAYALDAEPEADEEELPEEVADALEEAEFYAAQKLLDEARDVLTEALSEHPDHPALLRRLNELDGGDAASAGEQEPEDRSFALAQKLAEQQAGAEAQGPVAVEQVLQQFKEGVRRQVDASDTATHYDLGIAYMEMALHAEAIEEFKLCLDGDKQRTAHTMIGLCHVAKGEMQQGIDHFKLALRSPARDGEQEIDLWFELGNAYELLGKANDALVWYEKVEEQNPEFRDVAARIERLGTMKSPAQETDEIDAMFDNMILKD